MDARSRMIVRSKMIARSKMIVDGRVDHMKPLCCKGRGADDDDGGRRVVLC
jgi:hypothetical protein